MSICGKTTTAKMEEEIERGKDNFESFFKCCRKTISAMMKLALMRTPQERKTQSCLCCNDKFIRVTSLRNCSSNKCFTEFKYISTSTVHRRLLEIRPSWSNCCKETTTKGHQ